MDNDDIKELYQSLTLTHSKKPKNFGTLACGCHTKGKNPSCGDELELFLDIQDNKVVDVKFTGVGCALSVSSASLMTEAIKGKKISEVSHMMSQFFSFILEDESHLDDQYEPLHIYKNVQNYPLRVKCVLLPWRTLEHLIKNEGENIIKPEVNNE